MSSDVVTTTSGTSQNIKNIPSWVKRITVSFNGVSTNGTSNIILQLGVNGTPETAGYVGAGRTFSAAGTTVYSSGFLLVNAIVAARIASGQFVLVLLDGGTNTWSGSGIMAYSDVADVSLSAGKKSLAGILDMIRLTTVGGVDTFDAGNFSAICE